jgi:hypothetical protein
VVAPESIHQVYIGTEILLTYEQIKEENISFFSFLANQA